MQAGVPTPRRIAVLTPDVLAERMAGPAIRAYEIARALAADDPAGDGRRHEVRLVSTQSADGVCGDGFEISATSDLSATIAWAEVFVTQGAILDDHPALRRSDKVIVVDAYDPTHLEQLEMTKEHDAVTRLLELRFAVGSVNKQCLRADFVVCASARQRDFWLGHLAALGRVNPTSYDSDETLRDLIDVAPFGIAESPPQHCGPAIKGVVPGIGPHDQVLLWGGGIYNWFDPLTAIRAVGALAPDLPTLRLFFLGMAHPNPHVPEMRMSHAARTLAAELGLVGRSVFFNEQWVPYDRRGDYLLDADLGVSFHLEHVETEFSFRTRMLDYLWAGLPIACTRGDYFAGLVAERDLGAVVPPRDPAALAAALLPLLGDPARRRACGTRSAAAAQDYRWSSALAPLVRWCRTAHRAPDLVDGRTSRGVVRAAGRPYRPGNPLLRDAQIAALHLQAGGLGQVRAKALTRLRRRLSG